MSRNKENYQSKYQTALPAGKKSSTFESEIHPAHKSALRARSISPPTTETFDRRKKRRYDVTHTQRRT